MSELICNKKIEIYIHSFEYLYGNYYMPENAHLDNSLLNHLVLLASDTKITEKLDIYIWQKDKIDSIKFQTALKNSFSDTIEGVKKEIRANELVALISLLVGILVGIIATRVAINNEQLSSVVLIAFWVFIWYSIETYIFDNFKLKLKIRRYRQIMNADIIFFTIMHGKYGLKADL
ncbi:hypothetical protein [Carnobacterium maltaromaticum]|uniref:hypothetical protein n=1 Tax=Carnobacterium maltaromaticum TaxID=2751 RepID=UPI00295E3269|nr:hypothetical protein [Carnobacterium maltaromaticum]